MMSRSEQLLYALKVYEQYDLMDKKSRGLAVDTLASFGFDDKVIKKITGDKSVKVGGPHTNMSKGNWQPKALDALAMLAEQYENGDLNSKLIVNLAYYWGTSISAQAYFTGIPIAELRRALHEQAK